jgi:F0F1-type ATP synthase assembly protein I
MLALAMEPSQRPQFHPAGAGGVLLSGLVVGIGAGALIGWAAGSIGYGILAGAIVGVPAGVGAVYFRYRKAF